MNIHQDMQLLGFRGYVHQIVVDLLQNAVDVLEGREDPRIDQIVAPTSWNFSPRDCQGQTGALEQALENTAVDEGHDNPAAVQHIVRSFDPCMVCTVH